MSSKTRNLVTTLAFAPLALLAGTAALATPVAGTYYDQSDCAGAFGQSFNECKYGNSPIIAKADLTRNTAGNITGYNWTVNTLFPSVTGAEWNITFTPGTDGRQGSFVYTPGANDPLITAFVAKFGNDFIVYAPVSGLVGGQQSGSWNSADAGVTINPPDWDPLTDDRCDRVPTPAKCLPTTTLNMRGGLSHLSFYDTRVPVPEPTSLALLGLGLLGAGLSRRKSA